MQVVKIAMAWFALCLLLAVIAAMADATGEEAPAPTRFPAADVRRLCVAYDEAGGDSTDQVVLDTCRKAMSDG